MHSCLVQEPWPSLENITATGGQLSLLSEDGGGAVNVLAESVGGAEGPGHSQHPTQPTDQEMTRVPGAGK